jgi:hypothetical protein
MRHLSKLSAPRRPAISQAEKPAVGKSVGVIGAHNWSFVGKEEPYSLEALQP